MFNWFFYNRVRYSPESPCPYFIYFDRAQVFPFMIAILCIMLILVMITVNLGQISLIKTDVSNAADAAALAAASAMSQTLVGFGIKSDMMCGLGIMCVIGIVLAAIAIEPPGNILVCACIAAAWGAKQMTILRQTEGEGRIGWTSAKKTAIQYAFNNAGIDEPKPTFEQFVNNLPLGCPYKTNLDEAYTHYLKVDDQYSRDHARAGFSAFMEDNKGGYWNDNDCPINPSTSSPVTVPGPYDFGRYGWDSTANPATGLFPNSYTDKSRPYNDFQNWVDVSVTADFSYDSLDVYNFGDPIMMAVQGGVYLLSAPFIIAKLMKYFAWIPFGLGAIIATVLGFIIAGVISHMVYHISFGLTMDHPREIDNNYITVIVKRHKQGENLGLWNFQYGAPYLQAKAVSHTFRESDDKTIQPVLIGSGNGALWTFIASLVFSGGLALPVLFSNLDTGAHLFESELVSIQ